MKVKRFGLGLSNYATSKIITDICKIIFKPGKWMETFRFFFNKLLYFYENFAEGITLKYVY